MIPLRFTVCALTAIFFVTTSWAETHKQQTGSRPPLTIVTDHSWDISGQQTKFGEYPLSAEQIASATSPLHGGTYKAVAAEHNGRGKVVPGTVPIWRNRTATGESEAYQFRKIVQLGADPIQKITLEVNCDDVARIYINQRLVSVDKRDGKLKDGYDDWFLLRSVTGFMYDRIYTYDVTDYFFTNVNNTILAETVSLAFDGSHAYLSAKIVIEFGPISEPPRPAQAAAQTKSKPAAKPKAETKKLPNPVAEPDSLKQTVFEAYRSPDIEKLQVGSVLQLGHVYFNADDYRLDVASYGTLAALASFMKQYPSLKIEIGGHTNLRPSDLFAIELSTNRARSVVRYLTDNGVVTNRVTFKGYGKSQPRIQSTSKEADRVNRRVEVKVLEK